jgi:hypothetical protein
MRITTWRLLQTGALAILAIVGFDLFLHAGLLAPLYESASPFLLTPDEAFRRIPFGYLSFVLLVVLLIWLMVKLEIKQWKGGFAFGLLVGLLVWGAETLGLYSISTASPVLLLGWFLGQSLELGIAGLVVGSALGTERLLPLVVKVVVFFFISVVLSVILQNIFNFAAV